MTGFIFALLATLLAGIGARDQMTVAALALRQGQRPGLLGIAVLTSIATAAFAAYAGLKVAPLLSANARMIFAAIALALAGDESLLLRPKHLPEEPTQSLGATAIVLTAHQLTDAARFLVFAIAVATAAPIPAGLGGAVGGAATVTAGWLLAAELGRLPLVAARRMIGVVLLALAVWLALRALGRA